MISEEQLVQIVEEIITGTDMFLVDVTISHANKILVLVDTDKGIMVEECIELSRALEKRLDRDAEDFELEVSSPGLSQPLKILRQYIKNIGRDVAVQTTDNQKLKGRLINATQEGIQLETEVVKKNEKNKKIKTKETITLEFSQIKSTKVLVSF
jgi:ribosome maturation factor RimP